MATVVRLGWVRSIITLMHSGLSTFAHSTFSLLRLITWGSSTLSLSTLSRTTGIRTKILRTDGHLPKPPWHRPSKWLKLSLPASAAPDFCGWWSPPSTSWGPASPALVRVSQVDPCASLRSRISSHRNSKYFDYKLLQLKKLSLLTSLTFSM